MTEPHPSRTSGEPERPDPDALLRRVKDEQARSGRAKLKVFFGFAPGVGKTYRMLQAARDLIAEQKVDVAVGLVETHKRYDTAALLLGLELLPRRRMTYRGRVLEELDLDQALKRKPKILLVDELAHTNVPGSKHAKRWQDVLDLLDAGIDVHTTVNVQHVESLNDVIAQITGVRVRETVPDSILDRADEVELVDIAPEELLARLREGKVYLGEQAAAAAESFFRRGNLLALRELALRRTAQRVDADVLAYREEHGVAATWPAGERIVVGVSASPSSVRLIRAACRMAAGLRAPWVAVTVDVGAPPAARDRERLESHLRMAESLGATVARLTGPSVARAVLTYARKHNVTRIVIGKPTHAKIRDRLGGSLLDELVRGSEDVDVLVISGDERAGEGITQKGQDPRVNDAALWPRYAAALGIVTATTLFALGLRALVEVPDLEMLYLVAVMATAVRFGRGPAIAAAAFGVAGYDFFFVPPYHTFAVADGKYGLTFAMMFGLGIFLSELTARIRRQEQSAIVREERTAALYALARDLSASLDAAHTAKIVAERAADAFDADVFVWAPSEAQHSLELVAAHPEGTSLDNKEMGVVRWSHEHGKPAGIGTDTLPGAMSHCEPLSMGPVRLGVLAIVSRSRRALSAEQRIFLDAFCRQCAFAMERARLAEQARTAALRAKTEEIRSSLLSAVSHDLRTPLAAITGAATSMRDDEGLSPATRRELLDTVCEEADRLERLVGNLLDMTRLESGALVLRREWVPVDEVVGPAIERLRGRLGGRRIHVSTEPSGALVWIDPILFGQAIVNLLENAVKYTPEGTPIEVASALGDGELTLVVADHGPGVPDDLKAKIWEKFVRGAENGSRGVGLGLAICRGIAEIHGGTIAVSDRPGGGALFRIRIPQTELPPSVIDIPSAPDPRSARFETEKAPDERE